jgi:glycosyltransferase 2 family protein
VLEVWHAAQQFFHDFTEVDFAALGIALLFHVLRLLVRSRAWRNILVAAFPGERIKTRHVTGAYIAGVGVNAIVPARAGDGLKLYLVRKRVPGSNYPALASSLLPETLADLVIASAFLVWAFAAGILPGLDVLPNLPSIDWWWPLRHGRVSLIGLFVVAVLLLILFWWLNRKVDELRARLAQGLAILRQPRRYVTGVVSWQLLSWGFRLATVYWCLKAFHVPANATNVATAQVVDSLSTILPFSPGGVGTKQGLLVYMLRGEAPATTLLSFSVGMYIAVTVTNVVLGAIALLLLTGSLRFRHRVPDEKAPDPAVT